MSSPVAGTAAVRFVGDFSGLNREIARQANPLASGFGNKFGKALEPVMAQQKKHIEKAWTGIKFGSIAGAAGAAYALKDIVEAGSAFEKQISSNAAVSEASAKQLKRLEAQSIKFGKATFFSATQAAEAQGELIKGGLTVGQVLGGGLPASLALAEAGELELGEAAEATVGAMSTFGIAGKESMTVADGLSTAANKTTGEVRDFAEAFKQGGGAVSAAGGDFNEGLTILEAMAKALNLKGSDAGTSMKTALVRLAKPLGQAKTLTKELNLEFFDQNGSLKTAAGLSEELTRVMKDKNGQERLSITQTLGGTDGFRTLLALYDLGPAKLRRWEKANEESGTAQEIAAKKMDNFAGRFEAFKGSLETAEIQIYKGMVPALDALAEEGERVANKVGDIFSNDNLTTPEKLEKTAEFLGHEIGKLWDEAEIPKHAAEAFAAAAPVIAEAAAHAAVFAAEEFGKAFIHAPFIAKVAMGAWLINFIGGKQAFVGIAKMYGKQFGLGFTREAEASMAASAPAVIAESKAIAAASAQAAMTVPAVMPVATKSSFIGPGTGAARQAAAQAAAIRNAEMSTSYLGIPDLSKELAVEGNASGKSFVRSMGTSIRTNAPVIASSVASMGGRLLQGAATWGIGGFVAGQMVKEVTDSDLGTEVGTALQTAGVGAAIGNAIAPGIGGAIGAAFAGSAGFILAAMPDEGAELEAAGNQAAQEFLKGYLKNLPQLKKEAARGFLGNPGERAGAGEIPGTEVGATFRRGGTGLRGQRAELIDKRQAAGAGTDQAKQLTGEINNITKAIGTIKKDRLEFKGVLAQMSGDALSGVGQINKDLKSGLSKADSAWGHGTKAWRQHAVDAMQGASAAIKKGMEAGVIDTDAGQKRINALLRKINLTRGKDPAHIADGIADSFKEAGKITSGGVKGLIKDLDAMPKGARIKGIESIEGMTRAWAQGHPKLEKQVDLLTSNIKSKFGNASRAAEQGQQKSLQHIVEANTGASSSVAEALTSIGGNLTAALKALGAKNLVQFKITQEASAFHHRQGGGPIPGTFMVPGTGTGDTFRTALPPGSFIENRNAAQNLRFQTGGLTPVALEPKERVWLPHAVKQVGLGNLRARNAAMPRFQTGGLMSGNLPHPTISGAEPLAEGAQHGVDRVWKSAQKYLRAHMEPQRVLQMLRFAEAQASKGYPYVFGGGHGSFSGPYDCSGFVSAILHAGGFLDAPLSVQQGSGLYTLGAAGKGKNFTWGVRGTSGANAHTMIEVDGPGNKEHFFESGGSGGGAHTTGGWDGSFQFRHIPGFQRGGQVPEKAQEAIKKYGQDAFNPKSKHFVGWGYQRGGQIPKFATGGFAKGNYTVKHQPASGQQKHTAAEILEAGDKTGALQPPRVAALMAATQESNMGSTGNTFQLTSTFEGVSPSDNAFKQAVQWLTKGYYDGPVLGSGGGIEKAKKSSNLGLVAQEVEGSAYPSLYSQWESEGRNWAEGWGGKHESAKEEKEHTFKEDVPATYRGLPAKNSVHFPGIPKNLQGVDREIDHWTKQADLYRAAIKAAKRGKRPGLTQDLQHNLADVQNHLRELRNARKALRQKEARTKFSNLLKRKFGKLTGYETDIEAAQTAYEKKGEFADKVVDLEPLQPELPSEPEFPEQAKGESDTVYEKKRRDSHNAFEAQREAADKAYVGGFNAYVEGKEGPAYKAVLDAENEWRTKVLEAEQFAAGDWQKQNFLGGFEGRFEQNVVSNVENQEVVRDHIARLGDEIQKLDDWKRDHIEGWKKDHPGQALPDKLAAALKKEEEERADLVRKRDKLATVKLPYLKFKEGELRTTLGQARELFYPGKAEGGRRGFELKTNPPVPAVGSGSFEESLREIQGIHFPELHEIVGALPVTRDPAGYRGAIWDTQTAIEELGLKVTQANNSVQAASVEGPGSGSGDSADDSERTALLEELLQQANQRLAINANLGPVLDQFNATYPVMPPYAGKAHTGAIVPGPPSAEKTMILKGREGVFTQEQMAALGPASGGADGGLTVHVNGDIHQDPNDPRDPVEVFTSGNRRIDAHIEQVAGRARPGPGSGSGAGRAWRP